jgi:hypothetical protein
MIKKMRQALDRKGYTADEVDLLLNSFTELLGKLRNEARTNGARANVAKLPELLGKR